MIAMQLMADLTRAGIRLKAQGDRLKYSPISAMTPNLMARMKGCKEELLAIVGLKVADQIPTKKRQHVKPEIQGAANKIDRVFEPPRSRTGLEKSRPFCVQHQNQRWWKSIYGEHLICGICHSPVIPEVLREWVLDP